MNIYVGNLSASATDADLHDMFSAHGEVSSARVIKDRFSGEPRGFGFVEMPAKNEAVNAIKNVNGQDLNGYQLTVNEARPRTENNGNRGRSNGGNRW